MLRLFHLSLCPWKRTTARSPAVADTTGGTDDACPCGMSTTTYGRPYERRKSSVSAVVSSSENHVADRNSTQIRYGAARSLHSSRYSLLDRRIVNHCGNWNSNVPSLPASCSGSRAERNRSHTWSMTFASRSFG